MHVHVLYNTTSVDNTSTQQILLGLMSCTILSPQVHSSNDETEQQQSFFLRTQLSFSFKRGPENYYSKRGLINMTSCNSHDSQFY